MDTTTRRTSGTRSVAAASALFEKKAGGGGPHVRVLVIVSRGLMRGRMARGDQRVRRSAGGVPW